MKKKRLILLPVLPIIAFAVLYGGGYAAQFIRNYNAWKTAGGMPGNGTSPAFPHAGIRECFQAVFEMPYGLYGLGICLALFGLLILVVMRMGFGGSGKLDRERNLVYSEKGTYGTAGFLPEEKMRELLEVVSDVRQTDGIIVGERDGKILALPQKQTGERQYCRIWGIWQHEEPSILSECNLSIGKAGRFHRLYRSQGRTL